MYDIKNLSSEIIQYQPFKNIVLNRKEDIKARGANHKVHDYNGKIVLLKAATVWYNNDGNYVEPRSYEESICDICTVM